MMQESFHYYQKEKLFIRFKLDWHEVAGISKSSVNKMLGDDSLPFNESMHIRAFCTNTIDDCEDTISQKLDPSADVSVCHWKAGKTLCTSYDAAVTYMVR